MSFRTDLRAALAGSSLGLFDTWAEFWAACPLSRAMLIKHHPDGSERLAPERDTAYYEDKFFSGDSVGVVWYENNLPVTGAVFRQTHPGILEETIRIGAPVKATGLRRAFWDIGIRKLVFRVQMSASKNLARARQRYPGTVEILRPDIGAGYREFHVEYTTKPEFKDYDPDPQT